MSDSVLPMFSSRSFIVSGLMFRSLIHFEFIFVYSARKCVCQPSVCLLWRNVCLVLWPTFLLGCLFFWNCATGAACIFLTLILCQLLHLLLFSAILKAVFPPCLQFLCYAEYFKFNQVSFVYFCFYFYYSGRWVIEDPVVIYVRECFA